MPALEFIADMNISPLTVSSLKKEGWEIIRSSNIMDARSSDFDILNYAKESKKVIITHDLDFSELLAIYEYDSPSVINLRLGSATPQYVTQRIKDVVSQLESQLIEGIVVSVDDNSARFRNLPIK